MFVEPFTNISRADLARVGGKAANLGELASAGFPVPPGHVVTVEAYRAFTETAGITDAITSLAGSGDGDDPAGFDDAAARLEELITAAPIPAELVTAITDAYADLGGGPVAVRSSATAEDLADASFAGQQATYLNIIGDAAVLDAVRRCWASLFTARAMAYRARRGIAAGDVAPAVVVQSLVDADAAGVMFTANPANGRRHETVISAAWGLGEAVVSGLVDTDDLTVDLPRAAVISRSTADKQVMTVRTDTGTSEQPVPEARRRAEVLTDEQAVSLAAWGEAIERHYGAAQDIEWVLSGSSFLIVQARPITALPEPVGPQPTDWPLPRRHSVYFRASIIEQLPDPLTPLFADVAATGVPAGMATELEEMLDWHGLFTAEGITFPTINGYAYYCYQSAFLRRMIAKSWRIVPGLMNGSSPLGPTRWAEVTHPRYRTRVAAWADRNPDELTATELVAASAELAEAGFAYYTSVQAVIPPVAMSESLFTQFYRAVRRPGDPAAETFLLGSDSAPIRAEKSLYDLARWVKEDEALTDALLSATELGEQRPGGVDAEVWTQWRQRFTDHLTSYGHAVYNLDFATPVAADSPELLLDSLKFSLGKESRDPYQRQEQLVAARQEAIERVSRRLPRPALRTFTKLLAKAHRLAPIREDALADIGLAWPTIRRFLLAVGARLARAGAVDEPDDVFWLRRDEVDEAAADLDAGATTLPTRSAVLAERRTIWRGQRLANPPGMLPRNTIWRSLDSMMPSHGGEQEGPVIKGIPGSSGSVTAPARVLHGPQDFSEMRPGEVLVAAITTPAWTPLFSMAAAVVTDVGGPLSHSSIVAREYGIPAVLGTGVATRKLKSGQQITVDGDAGTVTLIDESD